MKVAGIICEYNPFHKGHEYHIKKTREAGYDYIVCVMSGDIVQRGEVALYSKHDRAGLAIMGGADLVLELPAPYCCGTAADFARAGVAVLKGLGVVDGLSFGAETDSAEELIAAVDTLENADDSLIKKALSDGLTYPQALTYAVGGETSRILSGANNTLAIEYIKQLKGSEIVPFAVKRTTPHDGAKSEGGYASASLIRQFIRQGVKPSNLLPFDLPAKHARSENYEATILFRLASMTQEDFAKAPYMGDGVAQRLYTASRRAESLEEIYEAVKTKNVTHARVRRAVLLAALGVKAEEMNILPPYARILAANERGARVLSVAKKYATSPYSASLADLSRLSDFAKRLSELDELCSRLQSMAIGERGISEFSRKFEMMSL